MSSDWFDESFYLAQKAQQLNSATYNGRTDWNAYAVSNVFKESGLTAEEHYDLYGAYEQSVNPNRTFDDDAYYASKAKQLNSIASNNRTDWTAKEVENVFKSAGISPVEHYLQWGKSEGIPATSVPGTEFDGEVTLSGDSFIDSLLTTEMPSWNSYYQRQGNSITYSFNSPSTLPDTLSTTAMDATQQKNTQVGLDEASRVTGIQFVEVSDADTANIVFGDANLATNIAGVTYLQWSGQSEDANLSTYIYIDDDSYHSLQSGTQYYEVLLHEIGHALGLKHPFEGPTTLPTAYDNTDYTLMSYTDVGTHSTYQSLDVLALEYLYGTDGLEGLQGLGSTWTV